MAWANRILRWLTAPASLRCHTCGAIHETADTLDANYPGGAICRNRCRPQLDGWVFRSRQGDVRDTAAAMIPDMDEQGEPK